MLNLYTDGVPCYLVEDVIVLRVHLDDIVFTRAKIGRFGWKLDDFVAFG